MKRQWDEFDDGVEVQANKRLNRMKSRTILRDIVESSKDGIDIELIEDKFEEFEGLESK